MCKFSDWSEFKLTHKKSVISDSLFLRFMNSSITREKRQNVDYCKDFIVVKFQYNTKYKIVDNENNTESQEVQLNKNDLRNEYYKDGVSYSYYKKDKSGNIKSVKTIRYKMLYRTPGKAKKGECTFIREELFDKAINYLTMGLYAIMDKESKADPEKVFKLVELCAYDTLTTATAKGFMNVPLDNILVVQDEDVYSDKMKAAVVGLKDVEIIKQLDEYVVDFDNPKVEKILNKKGYTFCSDKSDKYTFISEKSKKALKEHGIKINGAYPGEHKITEKKYSEKQCSVEYKEEHIKNVLWDGMGLVDDSIWLDGYIGFVYLRSHFFKSCLFRGSIQQFFKDYCEQQGINYDTAYIGDDTDLFGRRMKLSDIKMVITNNSIKWIKFIDMMGGTYKKAFKYYNRVMNQYGNCFAIVKSAHESKLGNYQVSSYQMNGSLPTNNPEVLKPIADIGITKANNMKKSVDEYIKYLEQTKNDFNINGMLLALVKHNPEFTKTRLFRKKWTEDVSKYKTALMQGELPQEGDNLTIMDNPVALLDKVVWNVNNSAGDRNYDPYTEGCFEVVSDGVQCYTPRFAEGERLAAFRSPHNSPNNIVHLYNVYPERLVKYFSNIGNNVIVFNAIGTDTQARLNSQDCDSDFVYATNQSEMAELARTAYINYPTIINDIAESGSHLYHMTQADYAKMDNAMASTQADIGISTDTAQLAMSYYYDSDMQDKELEDCFIILSVLGQVAIDLCKKTFDINVKNEITRIKRLQCMNRVGKTKYPEFYAAIKQTRTDKKFEAEEVGHMNCPMDILYDHINESIARRVDNSKYINLSSLIDKRLINKKDINKYKMDKFKEEFNKYNESVHKLNANADNYDEATLYKLKKLQATILASKFKKDMSINTFIALIKYADRNDNSVLLNELFKVNEKLFIQCFVKSDENTSKIL